MGGCEITILEENVINESIKIKTLMSLTLAYSSL